MPEHQENKKVIEKKKYLSKKSNHVDLTTTERNHNIKFEVNTSPHGSNPTSQLAQKNTQNEAWSSWNKHEVQYRHQFLQNTFQKGKREDFEMEKRR
jgi:hypothetical protein